MRLTPTTDPVLGGLRAFSDLPPWLARAMDGERVGVSLGRLVTDVADGRVRILSCVPQRLRAKGTGWLARYAVTIATADRPPQEVVLVGTLVAPTQEVPKPGEGHGSGGVGDDGFWCWLPDLRLLLRHEAEDEALPALPALTDPRRATDLLQPILRQAGYDGATIASCEPVVVRYKPGSRCTVVVGISYAGRSDRELPKSVVLKTHQGDKGERAWAAMTELWARPASWRGIVALAEPLGYLPQERILAQGPLIDEGTLKELARRTFAESGHELIDRLRSELSRTARGLAALHQSGAAYARTATIEDELTEIRDVIQRLAVTVPTLDLAAEPLLQRLTAHSLEHQADPVVPAHHDFRPAQVLLHDGGVGFIDFDGASMAEPALDLGRFRAKLRDIGVSSLVYADQPLAGRALAGRLQLLDDLCETFLSAYEEHAPVSRERVLLWETCDLLTGMLHAWTKVRLARLEPRLALLVHQLGTYGPTRRSQSG